MRYVKQARQEAQQDSRQAIIDKEIRSCACDERADTILVEILLTRRAAEHTDAEEERLMQDKHKYRRYEERTVTACRREERCLVIRGILDQ